MKVSLDHNGSCTKKIDIEIENGRIVSTGFTGGNPGSPQVLAALAQGMDIAETITLLRGFACNDDTSCPGRLASALEDALGKL
jgi:uncharacterized protein (TIGR03905 family)